MTSLAQKVVLARAAIAAAQVTRDASEARARAEFQAATSSAAQELLDLQARFSDKAFELALDHKAVPRSRYGMALTPDDCTVTEEGVQLQWYADSGPDDWFLATWDDLAAMEREEGSHAC